VNMLNYERHRRAAHSYPEMQNTHNMKKTLLISAVLTMCAGFFCSTEAAAQDSNPLGTVSYALPQTTLSFEVEATREDFFAGPFAKYASKYLGVEARQSDETTYSLTSVNLTPCIEADQNNRYIVILTKDCPAYLQMSAQGLISLSDGNFGDASSWRFTSSVKGDFSDKGVNSNYTTKATTLHESSGTVIQQNMIVSKTTEQRAKEAADMIFEMRKTRVQIITGDTDATYSGEAMQAALDEISNLEKEYLMLFTGFSEYQTQIINVDVTPNKLQEKQVYVAFRLSDSEGLVSADNVAGKPYFLEVEPQTVGIAESGKAKGNKKIEQTIKYRIPAICNIKLTDGVKTILQSRIPVYQLGLDSSYPIL